jgi:hypothetical protein
MMARRISFDIDDTLICYGQDTPQEPNRVPWLFRPWFHEPLRAGTQALMRQLIQEGWEIAIYTTSYRSPRYLRWFLWWHGIRVDVVVNQAIHDAIVRQGHYRHGPSKLPSKFGIDLHVDDSEGVAMEGQEHGFEVVVVSPSDRKWTEKVLRVARSFMARWRGR